VSMLPQVGGYNVTPAQLDSARPEPLSVKEGSVTSSIPCVTVDSRGTVEAALSEAKAAVK
jgi:hypothetical protein